MPEWSADLVRESHLACSRLIREEFLADEEIVRKIRVKVEETRAQAEAYGQPMTTHEYVTLSLGALADVVAAGDA